MKGIFSIVLCFGKGKLVFEGFVDVDLSRVYVVSKSIFGYIFFIDGVFVSYMFRFQKYVFLCIMDAEYVFMFKVRNERVCLKDFLEEIIGKK